MPSRRRARQNIYIHEIDLTDLEIKNAPRNEFVGALERIKYRGYIVENIGDGRKIVITKPGGKFTFGVVKREDFMVWVYDPTEKSLWLISHRNIYEDLEAKGEIDPKVTVQIVDALERVYKGEEPDVVLSTSNLRGPIGGESPELIMKAYKWIWGQEDVNYPDGKGRNMSWEGWRKEEKQWVRTGEGIADLRKKLQGRD